VRDGKLEHAVEDESPTSRVAAVEAEDELVDSFELVRKDAGEKW
jgi:hypothetical protein